MLIGCCAMYIGVRGSKFQNLNARNLVRVIQHSLHVLCFILGFSLLASYSMNWGWTDPAAFVYAGLVIAFVVRVVVKQRRRIRRGVQGLQNA